MTIPLPRMMRRMLSPLGRFTLMVRFYGWSWPVSRHVLGFYRRTALRRARFAMVIGSLGKSTTARALRAALLGESNPPTEYNVGGPVAVNMMRTSPFQTHRVLEIGIHDPGVMEQCARMIAPDYVVATTIKSEHWRHYPTPEARRAEKATTLRHLRRGGRAILNGDDPHILWMRTQTSAGVVTYGLGAKNDVRAEFVEPLGLEGMRIRGAAHGRPFELQIRLIGRHMAYPILAAIAVAEAEGIAPDVWRPRLEALVPSPDRLEPIALENGAVVLSDLFKATEETVAVALDTLAELPLNGGRKIFLMGRLEDPTEKDGPAYRRVGELAARAADVVVHYGAKNTRQALRAGLTAGGFAPENFLYLEEDMPAAIAAVREMLRPGDVALIKGRSMQKMERITLALQGRKVACRVNPCPLRGIRCHQCSRLERGFPRRRWE